MSWQTLRRAAWVLVLTIAVSPAARAAKSGATPPPGAVAAAAPAPRASAAPGYRTPPKVVADILTAPRLRVGRPNVSPDGARLILHDSPSLIPISILALPVEKLAGLEILPALRATRNQLKAATAGFRIVSTADGSMVRARLPEGRSVGAVTWSSKGDRLACTLYAQGGAEVWIVEAASGAARKLEGVALNTVLDPTLEWSLDDRDLFALTVADAGSAPLAGSAAPAPQARESRGRAAPQRTARDVLRTADDQARFAFYAQAQLARIPVDGGAKHPLGAPGPIDSWQLAPDERSAAIARFTLPAPLGFPNYLFPRTLVVENLADGTSVPVADLPLNDRSAISSVAELGPRDWQFAPDGRSLWFFSWKDTPGADPLKAIRDTTLAQPGTDRLMRLDAPFQGSPVEVATSDMQFRDMAWMAAGKRLWVQEDYAPRRRERRAWIEVADASRHPLGERSAENAYDNPGQPVGHGVPHGYALWTSGDGNRVYLAGEGFRADGQRPFLDALDLTSGRTRRVFESDAAHLENPSALLDAEAKRFLTLRQSKTEPPNVYVHAAGDAAGRKLSDFADPAPALTASQRIQFTFTRPDSVKLNAEVVLPADWKPGRRLPTVFWIYPNDFRSAAAASQNRRSPNRFPSQSALNPEVLVTQGYAVLMPDIAVVGTNDRYVEEIQLSAQAALDEAVRRGFCDPERVAVGGHSYGAFSTVNLLAHTSIFKAGWASDGAYNRTLTPFTFQAEERTLWEARDTYLKMSPFLYANEIKAPLLLMHNLDDTNVGTNPIQSERMFDALNGLGKTCALVEYPFEDHGPASRETVLDYWSRVIDWLDRWVKNSPGGGAAQAMGASR
jgi:dipeptidyl aminopeptidase/acylaminoacyl peptidase